MLYTTPLWLISFIIGSLYLLLPFTFFTYPLTRLLSGSHQFILWFCESVFVLKVKS